MYFGFRSYIPFFFLSVLGTAVLIICVLPLMFSANVMTDLLKVSGLFYFLSLLRVSCQKLLCLWSSIVLSSVYLHCGTEVTVDVFQQDPPVMSGCMSFVMLCCMLCCY